MIAIPFIWFSIPPPFWQDYIFQVRCEYPVDADIDAPSLTFATDFPEQIVTGHGNAATFDIQFLNDRGVPIGAVPIPLNTKIIFSIALRDGKLFSILFPNTEKEGISAPARLLVWMIFSLSFGIKMCVLPFKIGSTVVRNASVRSRHWN